MIGHTNMFDLYNYPLPVIFAVGLGVILGLSEIGWQLGVRAEGKGGSNLATLESAMLGLLALMIAFTFSMALSRFDASSRCGAERSQRDQHDGAACPAATRTPPG